MPYIPGGHGESHAVYALPSQCPRQEEELLKLQCPLFWGPGPESPFLQHFGLFFLGNLGVHWCGTLDQGLGGHESQQLTEKERQATVSPLAVLLLPLPKLPVPKYFYSLFPSLKLIVLCSSYYCYMYVHMCVVCLSINI